MVRNDFAVNRTRRLGSCSKSPSDQVRRQVSLCVEASEPDRVVRLDQRTGEQDAAWKMKKTRMSWKAAQRRAPSLAAEECWSQARLACSKCTAKLAESGDVVVAGDDMAGR